MVEEMKKMFVFLIILAIAQFNIVFSQIKVEKKNLFTLDLKIENSTFDTLKILNPCSYYYLKKDNLLSAYNQITIEFDTAYFKPFFKKSEIQGLINTSNFKILSISPNTNFNFKMSILAYRRKLRNKVLKIGYYTFYKNDLILTYAIYKF